MGMERFRRDGIVKVARDFLKHEGHQDESPEVDLADVKDALKDLVQASAKASVISGSIIGGAALTPRAVEAKELPHHVAVAQHEPHMRAVEQHPFVRPHIENSVEKHLLNKQDIDELTRNIFFESRNQPFKGEMAVALVTLARTVSKHWGDTIQKVVHSHGQFSWTAQKHTIEDDLEKKEFERLHAMLAEVFDGKPLGDTLLALAQFTGLPLDTMYYKRTDLDVASPEVSASTRELFTTATPVGTIGDHTFYALRQHPKMASPKTAPSQGFEPPLPRPRPTGNNPRA